jgi:cysteinyl-tRNA synthetase
LESGDKKDKLIQELIALLASVRSELRKKKLYDVSDYIREKLRELGIDIEDRKL